MRQPELMDEWGVRFNGTAKTVTGDFWWYEVPMKDGPSKRYPLLPVTPYAGHNPPDSSR